MSNRSHPKPASATQSLKQGRKVSQDQQQPGPSNHMSQTSSAHKNHLVDVQAASKHQKDSIVLCLDELAELVM